MMVPRNLAAVPIRVPARAMYNHVFTLLDYIIANDIGKMAAKKRE